MGTLQQLEPKGSESLIRIEDMPRVSRCAHGHAIVAYLGPECPVCSLTRRIGYSEKWCDRCAKITAHVGGGHISAACVQCVSRHPSHKIG